MITIRNKQTGRTHRITPENLGELYARGDQWRTLYEVIQEPPVPKEIKKLSATKKAESDNDGLSINNDGLSQQDAGQDQ
jgi:hypothetical protein